MGLIYKIMERKKKVFLIILYSTVILATILIIVYAPKKDLKKNKQEQIDIYNNSSKRDQIVKNFEDGKIIDKKNNNEQCKENAGGNQGIILQNNREFLKYLEIKQLVEIEKDIIQSIKNINNAIITDKSKVENYYMENKEILLETYGIENIKEYEMFINKVEYFKSKKITFCKVQENSMNKKNNYITFNLEFGNENKKEIIPIKLSNNEDDYKLKWILK